MKLYLNEIAPWERKSEYHQHIQLGKDINNQSDLILKSLNKQTLAQLKTAGDIVASQNLINETLQNGFGVLNEELNISMNRMANAFEGFSALFEWGISEVIWQLEQSRELLRRIEEGIWSPFDTQAQNRKKQAEEAFKYGWIDEAEEYFLESEKIVKIDFSVHISLGIIYLFHKPDKTKALEYFEKAIKYSKPKSPYYACIALLYKGLVMRDFNDLDAAEKCSAEAVILYPDYLEAYYQNAQYNALIGNHIKCLKNLEFVFDKDVKYVLKAANDEMFHKVKSKIDDLLLKKTELINISIRKQLNATNKVVTEYNKINNDFQSSLGKDLCLKGIIDKINMSTSQIELLSSHRAFFDSLKANKLLDELTSEITYLQNKCKQTCSSIEWDLQKIISQQKERTDQINSFIKDTGGMILASLGGLGALAIGFVVVITIACIFFVFIDFFIPGALDAAITIISIIAGIIAIGIIGAAIVNTVGNAKSIKKVPLDEVIKAKSSLSMLKDLKGKYKVF